MATKTFYLAESSSADGQTLSETAQTSITSATGWVVGTGSTNHSEMAVGIERASSTFTSTTPPDGSFDATLNDFMVTSDGPYNGTFAAGNWSFNFAVRAVTNGGAQDGRIRFRLLKGTSAASATEITAAQQLASEVLNVATGADSVSSLTLNPGAITLNNEYLFLQIAWERTGAGGMTSADVLFRTGSAGPAGTFITTTDFTQAASSIAGTAAMVFGGTAAPSGGADNPPVRSLARTMAVFSMAWAAATTFSIVDHTPSGFRGEPVPSSISGSSAAVFGGAGALTGKGTLAGTATVTFGGTGTTGGGSSISGASTLVFGGAGALTGKGALSGAAPATFSLTGALVQPVSYQPTRNRAQPPSSWWPSYSSIELVRAGHTVTGPEPSPVSGAAALSFTTRLIAPGHPPPPRRLTNPQGVEQWQPVVKVIHVKAGVGHPRPFGGQVTVTFGGTGTLQAKRAASGVALVSFTQVAALTGKGTLATAAPVVFGSTATLGGIGVLAGTAPSVFSATGSISGIGSNVLQGAASLVFGSAATLQPLGSLAGAAPVAFGGTADLIGEAPVAGSAPILFGGVGNLVSRGGISGVASFGIGVSAALTGTGALAGTAVALLDLIGDLTVDAPIAGVSSVAFSSVADLSRLTSPLEVVEPLVFSGVGSLVGTGHISGSSTLAFNVRGGLVPPLSSGGATRRQHIRWRQGVDHAVVSTDVGRMSDRPEFVTFSTGADLQIHGHSLYASAKTLARLEAEATGFIRPLKPLRSGELVNLSGRGTAATAMARTKRPNRMELGRPEAVGVRNPSEWEVMSLALNYVKGRRKKR